MAYEDHRHCKVCGKPCPPENEVCSTACRRKREEYLASRRNFTWLLYGGIVLVVILFVLSIFRV